MEYGKLRAIHTLGPAGTNLEAAARWWRSNNRLASAEIMLHDTLETAVQKMAMDGSAALIACIVYPELHTLVFQNMERLEISECFVYSTYNMVVASRNGSTPLTVATHRAPQHLAAGNFERVFVNSNSQAAIDCADGKVDGCITTLPAAKEHGLQVVKDFGPVPMGFSVHVAKGESLNARL
jgi:prephenate dehydratase